MRDSAQANRAREDFNRSVQALGAAAAASPFHDLLAETRAFSTQALGSLQAQPAAAMLDRCRAPRSSLRDARLRYAALCVWPPHAAVIRPFAARLAAPGRLDITTAPTVHTHDPVSNNRQ